MSIPANIRARFEIPDGLYLLSHSVGCLPRTTRQALESEFLDVWSGKGSDGWGDWLKAVDGFRASLAQLIGAQPQDICPQTNLSSGLSKIIGALPPRPGRKVIVLAEEDFPTVGFVGAAARSLGYELRFVRRGDAATDPAVWRTAMEGAQLAIITHTFSNRSARLPVAEITAAAREREVYSVVDAVQATGVIPYAVEGLGADFVLGTSVKFLCGGPGAGWLWVGDDVAAKCKPSDTGWFSHENPFEFDIHDYRPAAAAARFWGGTPSITPFIAARCGAEEILACGVEAIHDHNQDLIDHVHGGLGVDCIASETSREARGNAVLIRVTDSAEAMTTLRAARIAADVRDGCVRISPHLYNTLDEMDVLVETIGPFTV